MSSTPPAAKRSRMAPLLPDGARRSGAGRTQLRAWTLTGVVLLFVARADRDRGRRQRLEPAVLRCAGDARRAGGLVAWSAGCRCWSPCSALTLSALVDQPHAAAGALARISDATAWRAGGSPTSAITACSSPPPSRSAPEYRIAEDVRLVGRAAGRVRHRPDQRGRDGRDLRRDPLACRGFGPLHPGRRRTSSSPATWRSRRSSMRSSPRWPPISPAGRWFGGSRPRTRPRRSSAPR